MHADKKKVTRLINTAKGQLEGILRMIEEDRYCVDISTQLMASIAILNKANREVLAAHMRACVKDALTDEDSAEDKIEELVMLMEKMS